MRIFIIGFKSSGKTTIGAKLADELRYRFIDLDDRIEKLNNRSVPEIYSKDGEEAFRNKEWEALMDVCNEENVVVSTGGGAPCWCDNMNLMLQKGATVYLSLDTNTLVERLKKAALDRPIVKGMTEEELKNYVLTLKKDCEHHYLRAKYIVNARGLKVDELVEKIVTQIEPA